MIDNLFRINMKFFIFIFVVCDICMLYLVGKLVWEVCKVLIE